MELLCGRFSLGFLRYQIEFSEENILNFVSIAIFRIIDWQIWGC